MTKSLLRLFVPAALVLSVLCASARAELPIIAKARAYLGPEAALNAVTSLHFYGTLTPIDPVGKGEAKLEITFQAPYQQRIESSSAEGTETTALDGFDGWQRAVDGKDASKQRMSLLGAAQVRRLRANAWQSLAFYRGLEKEGGEVIDQGDATIDGIACRKVAFVHAKDIIFTRFFDKATGRLVLTETESGGTIREEGEIIVNGIRFPKSITSDSRIPGGVSQKFKVTFNKVIVNEKIPASEFALPMFGPQ